MNRLLMLAFIFVGLNARCTETNGGPDVAEIRRQQDLQDKIALIRAKADAEADAQIKIEKARATTTNSHEVPLADPVESPDYEASKARAIAAYPDSVIRGSKLYKAIAGRFATMNPNDPLWQNPDRAFIVAKQEAAELGIESAAEPEYRFADSKGQWYYLSNVDYLRLLPARQWLDVDDKKLAKLESSLDLEAEAVKAFKEQMGADSGSVEYYNRKVDGYNDNLKLLRDAIKSHNAAVLEFNKELYRVGRLKE